MEIIVETIVAAVFLITGVSHIDHLSGFAGDWTSDAWHHFGRKFMALRRGRRAFNLVSCCDFTVALVSQR